MTKKNDCQDRHEAIVAFVLEELENPAADEIRQHIDACRDCRALYEALTAEEETIRSAFEAIDARSKALEGDLVAQFGKSSKIDEKEFGALPESQEIVPARTWLHKWRTITKNRISQLTAATVVALVVIGGFTFWPGRGTDGKQWWLAPPTAWSQEITDTLDTFKCVTCREQLIYVEPDGSERIRSWAKKYSTHDRYRTDWYSKDWDVVCKIHWYVPDGSDMIQYAVRFDSDSYDIATHTGWSYGNIDPVERLRSCVEDLEKADRLLGTEVIEGRECVGFEIDKEDGMTDRIWFDVETKLPVRIEYRNLPKSPGSDKRITCILDQYDYDPGLSEDTFVPYIPEGFVPYRHDDSQIDIVITDEDLTVTEQPDGSFKAEIAVYNNGPDPAPKFEVKFYAVDSDKGGRRRLLASQAAGPIMPEEYVLSSHPGLELRMNESVIYVAVNPHNIVEESNSTNNKASKVIPGRQSKKPETSEEPKDGRIRQ